MTQVVTQALEKGNYIIGAKRALKLLRANKVSQIVLSSNVSPQFKEDIEYYASLSHTPVETLLINNEELSVLCKRPFLVNVIAILK